MMTSDAKGNDERITALLKSRSWYGRGQDAFKIVKQPLVPVVAVASGRWLITKPLSLVAKPGGHGVIWKLLRDNGVFEWLADRGKTAALVRQIR